VIDLNDVALFVQVARARSFAAAARQLGRPANTLSRRIQQLEAALGTRLLQRTTRILTLTAAGDAFYTRCGIAIDGVVEAGQALIDGSHEPAGLVRIAAAADFFDFFPLGWVEEFLARHPRVRLDFVLSDAVADLIADKIDIAFRGGPLHDSGYVARPLLRARIDCLVASPGYLAARGTPKTLQELARHDCLASDHPSGRTLWRLTGPDGGEEEVAVTGRFSANTAQALRKAAAAGLGIALLPVSITRIDVHAELLRPVLASWRRTGQGLSVVYPSRRQLPLAVARFIGHIVDKLSGPDTLPDAFRP
jgi:DNA-binding transcriptional LysR family regulator